MLSDGDDLGEALFLDRADEALGVCVEIGALGRQLDGVEPSRSKHVAEPVGEQWVAIVNQVLLMTQEAIEVIDK